MKQEMYKNMFIVKEGATTAEVVKNITSIHNKEEPFYIVNLGDILYKYNKWIEQLPRVHPFYAVKCNDTDMLLRIMADLDFGFDCASKGEIQKMLSIGVDESRIIYANPCKTNSHIKYASKVGVDLMTFDNATELRKIQQINPSSRVVLRIKCDAKKSQCTSFGVKYGVDVNEAYELLQAAQELDVLVVGVSFHVGSGCEDITAYPRAIEAARRVFDKGLSMGFPMELLDIGGGFPGTDNAPVTFTQLARSIRLSLDEHFPEGCGTRIIAEPGRYFAASAFTLSAMVIAKREVVLTEGKPLFMYYVNDGLYGSFNCLLYDHATVTASVFKEGEPYPCSIWGPTCDSLDKVVDSCHLPELDVDDVIYFENLGAYTLSAATTFNGFPKPKLYFYSLASDWVALSRQLSESTLEALDKEHSVGEDNPLSPQQFEVWKEESKLLEKKIEQLDNPPEVCAPSENDTYALIAPFL